MGEGLGTPGGASKAPPSKTHVEAVLTSSLFLSDPTPLSQLSFTKLFSSK